MILIIWVKNGNFFQKCTHSPYFDTNSLDYFDLLSISDVEPCSSRQARTNIMTDIMLSRPVMAETPPGDYCGYRTY